jgi:Tol biopolymer transport system component
MDQLLLYDGKPIPLPPKTFETLVYLVENPGRLVTREELIKAVWPNSFVEDGSLSVNISLIRRALGEMPDGQPYIDTVPRRGYRFRCPVAVLDKEPLLPGPSPGLGNAVGGSLSETRLTGSALHLMEPFVQAAAKQDKLEPAVVSSLQTEACATVPPPPAVRQAKWSRRAWIRVAGLAVAVWLVLWAVSIAAGRHHSIPLFASMRISRLTWQGQVADAVISPDGKYVVYALNDAQGQSLWIKQVAAPGDIQIVGPQNIHYSNLTISPNSNYLYYVKSGDDGLRTLYRMPLLGGSSIRVLPDVTGSISLSPDGNSLAFLQIEPSNWEASLMIARADGNNLHPVAVRKRPRYFSPWGLAWLPDGRAIACFAGDAADYDTHAFHIVKVRVTDGAEEPLTSRTWSWAGRVVNAADGGSLFITASEQAEDGLQVWRVSLPDGGVSRVTNDLDNYVQLSSASDGTTLAAVQVSKSADLWIARASDLSAAAPLSSGNIQDLNDLTWTPDMQIAYSARSDDYLNIFLIDSDGRNPKQLAIEPGNKTESAITADGRYVLYQSQGKIWRLNRDGTRPLQLTFGAHDVHPNPTPDGQSVIYASFANWSPSIGGKPTLWSVSINGGKPTELTTVATSLPQISPDGQLLAAAYFPDNDPRFSRNEIAVFHGNGGAPLKIFGRASGSSYVVRWAPGGKGLDYLVNSGEVGNIWRQSLAGGPPLQLTNFSSDQLFDFAWSGDGEHLAMARGKSVSAVVLIKDSETP